MLRKEIQFNINTFDAKEGIFTGYGNVFNYKDYAGDITQPGAFTNSLNHYLKKGHHPAMCWQHDTNKVIGVWTSAVEDEKGLLMTGKLVKGVQLADEALLLIQAGAIWGLSIGYVVLDEKYDPKLKANLLLDVHLLEVSLVTQPCNDMSRIQTVKSAFMNGVTPSERDIERALKELGCSSRIAKTFIASGYKAAFAEESVDSEIIESSEIINTSLENTSPEIEATEMVVISDDKEANELATSDVSNTAEVTTHDSVESDLVPTDLDHLINNDTSEEVESKESDDEIQLKQLQALFALVKQL